MPKLKPIEERDPYAARVLDAFDRLTGEGMGEGPIMVEELTGVGLSALSLAADVGLIVWEPLGEGQFPKEAVYVRGKWNEYLDACRAAGIPDSEVGRIEKVPKVSRFFGGQWGGLDDDRCPTCGERHPDCLGVWRKP